jgi:radical SAM superfamily enzyme YgiQ (UPF0313 family)
MRVSFLTSSSTDEITPSAFIMPPYWAATLFSNLPSKVKRETEVKSPKEICDFYFASFKACDNQMLEEIKNIRAARKRKNPKCFIVVGGWGPTLYPKDFARYADVVVVGAFNEATETFNELLTNWNEGDIENLEEIRGIFTQKLGFTGVKIPTLGKHVNWEKSCQLTHIRLSDYKDKGIGMLFLPLRISPLSCPNYVNPLLSNIKKGTKFKIGCDFCTPAYAAEKLVVELRKSDKLDLIDELTLTEDNFNMFFSRIKEEVTSALNQLYKEGYQGRISLYDCDELQVSRNLTCFWSSWTRNMEIG